MQELRDVEFSITPGVAALKNQVELIRRCPFPATFRKIAFLKKVFVEGGEIQDFDVLKDCIFCGFVALSDKALLEEMRKEKMPR